MPSLLKPRIYCFYCNSKSAHTKGDSIRSFQCKVCEGTNYLDQDGNITDVPVDVLDSERPQQRYATVRPGSVSPPSRTPSLEDNVFCAQCLKNQRFLADCLANYLPAESDPRYSQFEEGYPAYRKSLEQRYPQVCARCEPRVRAKLKQTAYAAKTDILAKSLNRGTTAWTGSSRGPAWYFVARPSLVLGETIWMSSLILQAIAHIAMFYGASRARVDSDAGRIDIDYSSLGTCVFKSFNAAPNEENCVFRLTSLIRVALLSNLLLLWWHPLMLRTPDGRVVNLIAYYQFQVASFVARFALWAIIERDFLHHDARLRGSVHLVSLALVILTVVISYRIIRPAPRKAVQFRSLDAPLLDRDGQQRYVSEPVIPAKTALPPRFSVDNLSHQESRNVPPMKENGRTSTAVLNYSQDSGFTSADAMDWEPVQPQAHSLRPRTRNKTPTPAPPYPITSAFSAQPIVNGPSPFYGTLPAAPKSMEAKLRTAAQQQPASFKPATDAKQADWFRRMRLSQASWASKEYVTTVKDPEKRTLELREPQLDLNALGLGVSGRRDGGTGLEDVFGSSFRIDDDNDNDSPVAREDKDPAQTGDRRAVPIWPLALIASIPLWFWCLAYLSGDGKDGSLNILQSAFQRIKELAYGE